MTFGTPLSIHALTRRYGNHLAVHDLSFEVSPGEVVGLLGPNGAGKTTLLETIEGVQIPTQGEVFVFGYPPRSLPADIRAKVSFVFQRNALPEHATVSQLITLYRRIYGDTEVLNEAAVKLGLTHLLKRVIAELSVGQRQRLSVFSALSTSPALIFMDEPTSALDLRSKKSVWDVILKGKRERSLSGLIATHNMEEAQMLCDRILFIENGQLKGDLLVNDMCEQEQSTLSVRFSAPQDFVIGNDLLRKLVSETEQGTSFYQIQCPKTIVSELISVILEGESSHGFDAQIEVSRQNLESAYFAHVSTVE